MLTALDLFCGAGGSSTGLVDAGFRVVLAANHWPKAVEIHSLNHPETEHECADISAVDPRRYPVTDILWASPECTSHSVAKGVRRATAQGSLFGDRPDPSAERSRATMWDVPRFAEAMRDRGHPYDVILVENVVDARWWVGWRGWCVAMEDLGYERAEVYLNSAFAHGKDYGWHGAPQYRDRLYVVFWRRGIRQPDLDITPPGWCPRCERVVQARQAWKRADQRWGRYRAQYVYQCPDTTCRATVEPFALPAATVIDWSDLGQPIGERTRPLAAATLARIRAGLARYGRPMLAPAGGTWNDEARPVDEPMRARTTRETEGIACPPMLVPVEARDGLRARLAAEPMRTQTARLETAFVAMLRQHVTPTPVGEPLATVVAAGNHHGLTVPDGFVMRNNTPRAGGTVPDALLMPYYGTGVARPVVEPAGTVTTRDRHALITRTPEQVPDDEVNGCTFRMLTPAEIGGAMAFPPGYRMGDASKRDRVRMYGNAVTPPAARLLGERVAAALAGTS